MRVFALLLMATCAAAVERWTVDQPDSWYDPMASHHGKHGLGGIGVGVVGYGLGALVTESRPLRFGAAVAAGAVVGFGYEAYHASAGTLNDPVDAGWVVAGAAVGGGLAWLTDGLLSASPTPDGHGAALTVAVRW